MVRLGSQQSRFALRSSQRWAWLAALAAALGACHGKGCQSDPYAQTSPSATASVAAGLTPSRSSAARSTLRLRLRSGALLALPAGATEAKLPATRVMDAVAAAHLYRFGNAKRLLMINELDPGGGCASWLQQQWQRIEQAKADSDPVRTRFRRVLAAEELKVAGQRALYTETRQRGLAKSDEQRPLAAMASLTLCRGADALVLMFATDEPELPATARKMLLGVAASYQAGLR